MATIAGVRFDRMFTAYGEDLGYLQSNGLHHYQYYCNNCNQIFSAAWGRADNFGWQERGYYFHCPHCKTEHQKHVAYIERGVIAPDKIRLTVREFKTVVTLEVFCDAVVFADYLHLRGRRYRETFRFDIENQRATWKCNAPRRLINAIIPDAEDQEDLVQTAELELGNPHKLDILSASILRFFVGHSLANAFQKSAVNGILKVLRETVHRKLEARLGYKIPSMFVHSGTCRGAMLVPIFNIAFRLACPDASNLPAVYREETQEIWSFWISRMLDTHGYMDGVLTRTRKGISYVSALAQAQGIPDKPAVRKLLAQAPFDSAMLKHAFTLCQNYDYAIKLYEGLRERSYLPGWPDSSEDTLTFFAAMKLVYGEAGIVRLATKWDELYTRDCIRLFHKLNKENQMAIFDEGVSLRDLHGWMSLRHLRQEHKNVRLNVPKHIARRLSMQRDRLKFFLPKESIQLLEAGHRLHNCVGSYWEDMHKNRLQIVLVADNIGKLIACLEIKGKTIVQARLDRNVEVKKNPEVNQAILEWARKAQLTIKTSDIEIPGESEKEVAV